MNRIKEVIKLNNLDLKDVAAKMGVTRQSLYSNMQSLKFAKLVEIAKIIGCEPAELVECGDGYAHFYDPETKEWLGIRKK